MVAETSFPSISVGYEISLALSYEKPVLLLYHEGDPPSLFAHHKDDKVLCEKYTLENLPHIIDHFIRYAQGTKESRFNFFLTSEISSFLKKVSKREKVPKSVYLRRLIEKEMKNQP